MFLTGGEEVGVKREKADLENSLGKNSNLSRIKKMGVFFFVVVAFT